MDEKKLPLPNATFREYTLRLARLMGRPPFFGLTWKETFATEGLEDRPDFTFEELSALETRAAISKGAEVAQRIKASEESEKTTAGDVLTQIRERLLSYEGDVNLLLLMGEICAMAQIPTDRIEQLKGDVRERGRAAKRARLRSELGPFFTEDPLKYESPEEATVEGATERMVWSSWKGAGAVEGEPVVFKPGEEIELAVEWPFEKMPPGDIVVHDPMLAQEAVVVGLGFRSGLRGPLPCSLFFVTTPRPILDFSPKVVLVTFRNNSLEPIRIGPGAFDVVSRRRLP